MFPLYDSSPRKNFPVVNTIIIIANIYVFYLQLTASSFDSFVYQMGFIPAHFDLFNFESYSFIVTSMFLHGGIWHIASNLWFLHIFGDNVEDRMGHVGYAVFYIIAGIIATLAQYILNPGSIVPLIGASGAISGVAGAYFILFRNSRIKSLILAGFYITTANLPAWLFLGYWFVIQVITGVATYDQSSKGGTAFFAHIGGFIFGLLVGFILSKVSSTHDIMSQES